MGWEWYFALVLAAPGLLFVVPALVNAAIEPLVKSYSNAPSQQNQEVTTGQSKPETFLSGGAEIVELKERMWGTFVVSIIMILIGIFFRAEAGVKAVGFVSVLWFFIAWQSIAGKVSSIKYWAGAALIIQAVGALFFIIMSSSETSGGYNSYLPFGENLEQFLVQIGPSSLVWFLVFINAKSKLDKHAAHLNSLVDAPNTSKNLPGNSQYEGYVTKFELKSVETVGAQAQDETQAGNTVSPGQIQEPKKPTPSFSDQKENSGKVVGRHENFSDQEEKGEAIVSSIVETYSSIKRVSSCVLDKKVKYIDSSNPSECLEAVYLKRFEENGIGATASDAARACEQFSDLPEPLNARALAITILCVEEPELAQKCTKLLKELEEIVDINEAQIEEFEHSNEPQSVEAIEAKLDNFEKAQAAIEYVPKVADAWKRVEALPEQFKLKFLKSLDADTRQDVEALVVSILSDHERSERPYENPELNDAFEEAKLLGEAAVAEFRRVIDLLGEPEDISEFLQKLKGKFVAANAKEQLTHAMQVDDEQGMLAGLRDLGIRVKTDFNGKKNPEKITYRVYFNYREHSLFGAAELKVFIKNVILV